MSSTSSRPKTRTGATPPEASLRHPWLWVQGQLKRHFRVERRGAQIHVVLDPARAAPVVITDAGADAEAQRVAALRKAHGELRDLLDRHPDTRHVMPHLNFVERSMATGGVRASDRLPLPVLHKALKQLDDLMHDEAGVGLTELRRRIVTVIALRMDKRKARGAGRAPIAETLEVSEGSHSQFDELERSWTGTLPMLQDDSTRGPNDDLPR